MTVPAWDATATLTLPYSPDLPPPAPSTLREALASWRTLGARDRSGALLFVSPGSVDGEGVLGAARIEDLARRLADTD